MLSKIPWRHMLSSVRSLSVPSHFEERPQHLRWHPVRLLYTFAATLVVGILYSEVQALLANPSWGLNLEALKRTFF
jgi:hypothetical protein